MWRRNRWIFLGGVAAFAVLYLLLRNAPPTAPAGSGAIAASGTGVSLPERRPTAAAPPASSTPTPARQQPPADPLLWRTVGGHIGAVSRAKLDQATTLVAQGDREAFERLLATDPGVFVLAEGLEVYVADSDGVLSSVVKVRKKGTTAEIWTVREAIAR